MRSHVTVGRGQRKRNSAAGQPGSITGRKINLESKVLFEVTPLVMGPMSPSESQIGEQVLTLGYLHIS